VPWIIRDGADTFLALGRRTMAAPRFFPCPATWRKPGNFEVRSAHPFSVLLDLAGGMRGGKKIKAVIPGGSSMPVLPGALMMATEHGL